MRMFVIGVIDRPALAGLGVLSVVLSFGLLTAGSAAANWSLQGDGPGCRLESAVKEMATGYNDARVKILVDKRRVVIESDAKLDEAFGDLGLKVDRKSFAGIDRVEDEHKAVIESDYDALIRQFKAGFTVALQLRFWPTWPTTGAHGADFSLVGFTKAYDGLAAC